MKKICWLVLVFFLPGLVLASDEISFEFDSGTVNMTYLGLDCSYITGETGDACSVGSGGNYTNGTGLGLNDSNFFSILDSYALPQSCTDGYVAFYNATSVSWYCGAAAGAGTVTQVTRGWGFNSSGTSITTTGTLVLNETLLKAVIDTDTDTNTNCSLSADCPDAQIIYESNTSWVTSNELDANHDECSEISGCIEDAWYDVANISSFLFTYSTYFNQALNTTSTVNFGMINGNGSGLVSINCSSIIQDGTGSDDDFCNDDAGVGAFSYNTYFDQNLNTTNNVTFAAINSQNWENVTITESQITDLSHTVDTNTNCSLSADCPDAQIIYESNTSWVTSNELDADHDTCAEITGCIEDAFYDDANISGLGYIKSYTDTFWPISTYYFMNVSGTLTFNETKLNATISALAGADGFEPDNFWPVSGYYIYNLSDTLTLNETLLNATIAALDTDTDTNTNCSLSADCPDAQIIYESNTTWVTNNELDADHDTCAEITGCIEDAYYDEANLTAVLDDNYVNVAGDTMTGSLNMSTHNITNVDYYCINPDCTSYIYHNGTHSIWI